MNEFISSGDNIILNTDYAEAYIPEELIGESEKKSTLVGTYGEGIKTIGLFNIRFFGSEYKSDSDNNKGPLRVFNYPNIIITYPTSYAVRTMSLKNNDEPEKFLVLYYEKGDIIMSSETKQDSENCEMFLNVISAGKIPNDIDYKDSLRTWETNFEINGLSSGVPSIVLQCMLAEKYRSKANPMVQFRKIAGKGKYTRDDYIMVSMADAAAYSSVFGALTADTSAGMTEMLSSSLVMSRKNMKQSKSPIEKVLS